MRKYRKIFEFEIFDYIINRWTKLTIDIFKQNKSALKYRNALSELNKATRLINQLSAKEA